MKIAIKTVMLNAAIAASTILSGCADGNGEQPVGSAIVGFDFHLAKSPLIEKNGSRALPVTTDNITDFGVYGYYNGGFISPLPTNSVFARPDFMCNQKVEKSGGSWTYSPIKYWPCAPGQSMSFYAYAPYGEADDSLSPAQTGYVSMPANDASGKPFIEYQPGTNPDTQRDLLFAFCHAANNSSSPNVNFNFRHALSRVCFKAVGWEPKPGETYDGNTTVTINSVKLCTNRASGKLSLYDGAWAEGETKTTNSLYYAYTTSNGKLVNNVITAGDTSPKTLCNDDQQIMMLPDLGGSDEYWLYVDYTVTTLDPKVKDGKFETRSNIFRRIQPHFEKGKAYNLIIHLGINGAGDYAAPNDGIPVPDEPGKDPGAPDATHPTTTSCIGFSATSTDWDGGAEMKVNLSK